jgi:hypothetical protein
MKLQVAILGLVTLASAASSAIKPVFALGGGGQSQQFPSYLIQIQVPFGPGTALRPVCRKHHA